MVNLELYRLFVIVANEGNITKASEILHISQPAISKQIHNLESELNITLFERSNSGVRLTIEGNKLGLGVNLFSDQPTIIEEKGLDAVNN